MPKSELQAFLGHLSDRQAVYGPESAFRFEKIKLGGEIVPARYPDDANRDDNEEDDIARTKERASRSKKRRAANQTIKPHPRIAQSDMNPDQPPVSMPATIIVGQAQMDFIRQRTQQVVPATNGPGDGPPKYAVPVEVYQQVFGSIDHRLVMSDTEPYAPALVPLQPEGSLAPLPAPSPAPLPAPSPAPTLASRHDDPAPVPATNTHKPKTRKRRTEVEARVALMGAGSRATRASTRASARELRSHRNTGQR